MVVGAVLDLVDEQAQLLPQKRDVVLVSRQEQPPGPIWNFSAYSLSTSGVSRSGSMVIEYRNTSRPTRSPRIRFTFISRAVSSGQEFGQLV